MSGNTTTVPVLLINKITTLDLVLTISTALLSILGALVLIFAHIVRHRRGTPIDNVRHFLICLTIADAVNAAGQLMGAYRFIHSPDDADEMRPACHTEEEGMCIFQSYLTTFSSLSSFFWTFFIAFHLYWTYGEQADEQNNCCRKSFYHIMSWGVPLIITTTAVAKGVLGSDLSTGSGAWCWISACLTPVERTVWMTVSGKGWEILMYCSCLGFYGLLKKRQFSKVKKKRIRSGLYLSKSINQSAEFVEPVHGDIRFLFLWLIEVLLRMFGTVRYIIATVKRHSGYTISAYSSYDEVLLHFQSFGDSAQALCSFLLFCVFDKEMRKLLKETLCCVKYEEERIPILSNETFRTSRC